VDAIKDWCRRRDAALLSLDEAAIRKVTAEGGEQLSSNPEVFWRAVHKARTALRTLPMEARTLSKRWLREHNSEPWDDGEVPA
jgi:hypothetical protein